MLDSGRSPQYSYFRRLFSIGGRSGVVRVPRILNVPDWWPQYPSNGITIGIREGPQIRP